MSTDSKDAKAIFLSAVEMDSVQERRSFLDEACSGDTELRSRVEELLSSFEEAGSFMEKKLGAPFAPTVNFEPITESPGTVISNYKLLQQIGEGGFGVVFMAEQHKPVRRKVALKVIKPGMDTKEVVARFEAERQALALMDHPNIARVFDAGATDTGRPYFCDGAGQRSADDCVLRQEQSVAPSAARTFCHDLPCSAACAPERGHPPRHQAKHIMVTLHDGKPVPKVIDFGVAKATSQQLTEKTLFTAYGQVIGTPTYMSPEQAEMSGLDIDTRSDIYAWESCSQGESEIRIGEPLRVRRRSKGRFHAFGSPGGLVVFRTEVSL